MLNKPNNLLKHSLPEWLTLNEYFDEIKVALRKGLASLKKRFVVNV